MRVDLSAIGAMEQGFLPQTAALEDGWDAGRGLLLIALLPGTNEESPVPGFSFTTFLLPGIMHVEFARPVLVDGPGNTIS